MEETYVCIITSSKRILLGMLKLSGINGCTLKLCLCKFCNLCNLHSAKHKKNTKKIENPLRGSISCAAALRRAAHQMMGLGQSLRDHDSDDRRKTTG